MEDPFLVIAPGARSDIKRWPSQRFRTLAKRLYTTYGLPIVLVGDRNEIAVSDSVALEGGSYIINLCGETSVQELAVLIHHALLVITNDSASLHLADLQNQAVVAIFGPTSDRRYGPRGARSKTVRKQLFCSPCEMAQCKYHHECMDELDEKEVLDACRTFLPTFPPVASL